MRRSVLLALAVAALCALVFQGCADGGDTEKAKLLLRSADKKLREITGTYPELTDSMQKFFANGAEKAASEPDAVREEMRGYEERLAALLELVPPAQLQYREVQGMEGVGPYKEYARLKLLMLDQVVKTGEVVGRMFPAVKSAVEEGEAPDANALEGAKRELICLEMEYAFDEEEAKDMDQEKRLTK